MKENKLEVRIFGIVGQASCSIYDPITFEPHNATVPIWKEDAWYQMNKAEHARTHYELRLGTFEI